MADLASLGLEVKSSDVEAATKALGEFSASGKSAQVSADVLVASAVRLGISVEEVEKRLAAANDNLNDNAAMAIKLADATKIASAANDNFSQSMRASNAETASSGRGFLATLETILNLTSHLKLLALAAYALVPAFRGFVNAGISKVLLEIIPASELAQKTLAGLSVVSSNLFAILARITPPILMVVVAFEMISAYNPKKATRKIIVLLHICAFAPLESPESLKYWSTLRRVIDRNSDLVLLNFNGIFINLGCNSIRYLIL